MQQLLYSIVQYSEYFSTYAAVSVSKAENTCVCWHMMTLGTKSKPQK